MVNVFIVEDDPSLIMLYEKALKFKGYSVIGTAKNGQEAVDSFKLLNNKPDIILMDHRMPVKNGLEAAKEILEFDGNTKIIFASADKTVRDEALALGALSFKNKPFTLEQLFSNIEKAIKAKGLMEVTH